MFSWRIVAIGEPPYWRDPGAKQRNRFPRDSRKRVRTSYEQDFSLCQRKPRCPVAERNLRTCSCPQIRNALGTGVKLKRSPVERLAENAVGVQQRKFRRTKRRFRAPALVEFAIEFVHEAGG